ncbi:MAG: hypothetical protein N2F24_05245, partial [Deltaproteobacteria bacterium]
ARSDGLKALQHTAPRRGCILPILLKDCPFVIIRILAQGCRSETEATLGTPAPLYPNPNGVASLPESIPGVFLIPALAMLIRFPDKREKNSN